MTAQMRRTISWVSAAGVALVVGIGAFMLLGAAQQGGAVLQVDVGAWIHYYTTDSSSDQATGVSPVRLFLAVTSPTRGVVEQLQSGNVRV